MRRSRKYRDGAWSAAVPGLPARVGVQRTVALHLTATALQAVPPRRAVRIPRLGGEVDVVSAVDAAVADRVDVLSLALGGGDGIDTLQRALLGAAEADIVVIGAAGNSAGSAYAAHSSPWVTTVGSAVGRMSRGRVAVRGELPLAPLDNAEGLAVERLPAGGIRMWIVTDNDFAGYRRTLLLAADVPAQNDR